MSSERQKAQVEEAAQEKVALTETRTVTMIVMIAVTATIPHHINATPGVGIAGEEQGDCRAGRHCVTQSLVFNLNGSI